MCIVLNVLVAINIGETGRPFSIRLAEHEASVKNIHPQKSALSKHAIENTHNIDWKSAKLLHFENHWQKRRIMESVEIAKNNNNLFNGNVGWVLDKSWMTVF